MAITPEHATIFAAIATVTAPLLSIITSVLTTRYTLRHGPNYERQISDLNKSLSDISQTHSRFLSQQAASEQAAEQRRQHERWKPDASIQTSYDGTTLKNELILKSQKEFAVFEVALLSDSGAKLATIRSEPQVCSTGFKFQITHHDILELTNKSVEYVRTGTCPGKMSYRVRCGDTYHEGMVPFRAQQESVNNTLWIRLVG